MYKRMVSTKYAGQKEYERAIVEGNRKRELSVKEGHDYITKNCKK